MVVNQWEDYSKTRPPSGLTLIRLPCYCCLAVGWAEQRTVSMMGVLAFVLCLLTLHMHCSLAVTESHQHVLDASVEDAPVRAPLPLPPTPPTPAKSTPISKGKAN